MEKQDQMIHVKIDGLNVIVRTNGEMPSDEAMLRMKQTLDDLKHKERRDYENCRFC